MAEDVDPADTGLEALARLQAMILRSREIGKNGGNLEVLYEEQVEDLVATVWMLDLYLTGKTENRRADADAKRFYELFVEAKDFHVHLSDGGYSRITIHLEDGHPVYIDRTLSRDPVKKKWSALFPPH